MTGDSPAGPHAGPRRVSFRVRHSALTKAATQLDATATEVADIRAKVGLVGTGVVAPLSDHSFGKLPNSARLGLVLDESLEKVTGNLEGATRKVSLIATSTRSSESNYRAADGRAAALLKNVAHRRRNH